MSEEIKYVSEKSYFVALWFRRILVPVDGSGASLKALDLAIDFAKRYGSSVTVLSVVPENFPKERVEEIFSKVREKVMNQGIQVEYKIRKVQFPQSSIATEILREAEDGLFDLIIIGAKGLSGDEETPIGSVAAAVAVLATCSVIIIR
ncbi:MAG: universal stress protein [Candidatus Njordarchaeales archaeon]